jgi:BMFP domain-containing protein YqiC
VYGDGKAAPMRFRFCRSGFLSEADMVQTTNRFFDEVARLMNDAAGAAQGMRREAETMFRTQTERLLREFAVVQREEFEAVKDMARLAREENEALKARVTALEARLAGSATSAPASASSTGWTTPASSDTPASGGTGTDIPPHGHFG